MILQCPACEARFLVSDAAIPAGGRTVRCGQCRHEWHATHHPVPMEGVPAEPSAPQAPAFAEFFDALASASPDQAEALAGAAAGQANLPALAPAPYRSAPMQWAVAASAVLLLILTPFAFYPSLRDTPVFSSLYTALGWPDSRGLVLADVAFSKAEEEGKTRYRLSGNIINRAGGARTLDTVRIALRTREGETLWSRVYTVGKALEPGGIYPFDVGNIETRFGNRVRTVMMDVGNSYELKLR